MCGYEVFYAVNTFIGLVTVCKTVKNTFAIKVIWYQWPKFSKNSVVNRSVEKTGQDN